MLPGSDTHIRGYFFEKYPQLTNREIGRRHASHDVKAALSMNHFELIDEIHFWETRRTYGDKMELEDDLRGRTGRSILHELTDEELEELIRYIGRLQGRKHESDHMMR